MLRKAWRHPENVLHLGLMIHSNNTLQSSTCRSHFRQVSVRMHQNAVAQHNNKHTAGIVGINSASIAHSCEIGEVDNLWTCKRLLWIVAGMLGRFAQGKLRNSSIPGNLSAAVSRSYTYRHGEAGDEYWLVLHRNRLTILKQTLAMEFESFQDVAVRLINRIGKRMATG